MMSFGASRHFPVGPVDSLVNVPKPKSLYDPPNALYTMLCGSAFFLSTKSDKQ